ncbi:MAG: hypothetical protein IPG89_15370 [Bacteroidetes bacterium]|nr:hypothetical protein [Bacteroidota bacterium]
MADYNTIQEAKRKSQPQSSLDETIELIGGFLKEPMSKTTLIEKTMLRNGL